MAQLCRALTIRFLCSLEVHNSIVLTIPYRLEMLRYDFVNILVFFAFEFLLTFIIMSLKWKEEVGGFFTLLEK